MIKLKPKIGVETYSQIRGTENLSTKWFGAAKNSSGIYELTAKGELKMEMAKSSASKGDGGGW